MIIEMIREIAWHSNFNEHAKNVSANITKISSIQFSFLLEFIIRNLKLLNLEFIILLPLCQRFRKTILRTFSFLFLFVCKTVIFRKKELRRTSSYPCVNSFERPSPEHVFLFAKRPFLERVFLFFSEIVASSRSSDCPRASRTSTRTRVISVSGRK